MARSRRRISSPITAWPGYVDVLSALLMVVIFVLMVFIIAQFLLSQVLHGQKDELAALHAQVEQLTTLLGLEKEKALRLDSQVARLSGIIDELTDENKDLAGQVSFFTEQADKDQAALQNQLMMVGSLNEDIAALRKVRDELEARVGSLASSLSQKDYELTVLRDRSRTLSARLADQSEKTHLAQKKIEARDIRIQALTAVLNKQKQALEEEKQLSADARAEVALLTDQVQRLRDQLNVISNALALSKEEIETKDDTIQDLGEQLNIALARKIHTLETYRSEFFGRMRAALGDHPAIQIQGDRFVFQAELLFESGSADLGQDGQKHLAELAEILADVAQKIPDDIQWILRIDGHTDTIPINNQWFSSNWELSTARALSVVKFLARQGIPEKHMAAAGFSQYHPVDPGSTPAALQKNRRIEIKLTTI